MCVIYSEQRGERGGRRTAEGGCSTNHRRPFVGLSQPRSAPFLEQFCGKLPSKVDKPGESTFWYNPPKRLAWDRSNVQHTSGRPHLKNKYVAEV